MVLLTLLANHLQMCHKIVAITSRYFAVVKTKLDTLLSLQ